MPLFSSENINSVVKDKDIFLDNDFLDGIFKNIELFDEASKILSGANRLIDPLVAFEFLQTVYIPEEQSLREKFLTSDFLLPSVNHQDIFMTSQENGLVLSRIYRHTGRGKDASVTDLLLAGKIMFLRPKDPFIITGNKKHFPSCVFDTVGIMTWEKSETGDVIQYFILKFDQGKFDECYSKLQKVKH